MPSAPARKLASVGGTARGGISALETTCCSTGASTKIHQRSNGFSMKSDRHRKKASEAIMMGMQKGISRLSLRQFRPIAPQMKQLISNDQKSSEPLCAPQSAVKR